MAQPQRNLFALGLGLFCAGAGTVQVLVPRQVNQITGMDLGNSQQLVFRGLGLRDLVFAFGLLTSQNDQQANRRWLQLLLVALLGDSVLCGQALTRPKANVFTWLATLNSLFFAMVVLIRLLGKENK